MARRPSPHPVVQKKQQTLFQSLSAWTDNDDEDEVDDKFGEGKQVVGHKRLSQMNAEYQAIDPASAPRSLIPEWAKPYLDVEGTYFSSTIGVVILLNAFVIGLETEFGGGHFLLFEHLFNSIFLVEMILRMRHLGILGYFQDPWNVFDFSLVSLGALDLWILPMVTGGQGVSDTEGNSSVTALRSLRLFRVMRILRVLRVLRVIRLFRMFKQLSLIIQAFIKAFQVVLLIGVLVLIFNYILSIFLTQVIGHHAADWGDDAEKIEFWFGTLGRSMRSLFIIMTLCDWDNIGRTIVKQVPEFPVFAFMIAYIVVVSYTVVSLVTAIISDSLIAAQDDHKHVRGLKIEEKRKVLGRELTDFLMEIHEDCMDEGNNVEASEMKSSLAGDAELIEKLGAIDIAIGEKGVMALIDQLSGEDNAPVNIDYFVDKLTNLTGLTKASAVADMNYTITKLEKNAAKLEEAPQALKEISKQLDKLLK